MGDDPFSVEKFNKKNLEAFNVSHQVAFFKLPLVVEIFKIIP
jgi:hypothetical protein